MKTDRSLRSINSHFKPKHSNSPTLESTYSERGFLNKSYQNEPRPKQLRRRLIGRKFKLSDFSDEEQDTTGIVLQEEETEVFERKNILPHVTIMSDRGEFLEVRSRIKSQRKQTKDYTRSKSVESLKLPQVMEEKKQEDELQKLERSKLSQFKDKNQFNQRNSKHSQNNSHTENSRDSHEPKNFSSAMPEQIVENEAEETKSEKLKRDRSIIQSEMQKLIVDEIDDRKWKKQESQQQIEEIIEQEKQEEEIENVKKLRISLGRFQQENEYLNKFKEEEFRVSGHNSQHSDTDSRKVKRYNSHKSQVINE